jgi:hypothetical protein
MMTAANRAVIAYTTRTVMRRAGLTAVVGIDTRSVSAWSGKSANV